MQETSDEVYLQGLPVSDGIAIGTILFLEELPDDFFPSFPIKASDVGQEISRYRRALQYSRKDLENLQYSLAKEGSKEAMTIINTHIQMLEDPVITTVVEEKIGMMLQNTEAVFRSVMFEYEQQFSEIADDFFKQRLLDVKDLSKRILHHLHPAQEDTSKEVLENKIVFADELVPSLTAEASSSNILGFVTKVGGGTSHAALIAKAKAVPYVSSIDIAEVRRHTGQKVIIDGNTGEVIINPSKTTLEKYQDLMTVSRKKFIRIAEEYPAVVSTNDGVPVDVWANIENIKDLSFIHSCNIGGVGLLRSEFLYLKNMIEDFSEEQQYHLYEKMVKKTKNLPVNFRVFDVGGDKHFSAKQYAEPNPALGCRSIRFLLRHPEIFVRQLRALLRVASQGDIRLLLPLVTDVGELLEAKAIIFEVMEQLKQEGVTLPKEVKIGCMIEIPSAVVLSDQIASASDFLSIGTNDLVQYTLAADRGNPVICDMYKPAHPSILRMIKIVVDSGKKQGIPVSVCGEVASNPLFTALLLGLGLRQFSCPPRYVPLIKETVTKLTLREAEELAQKALSFNSTSDVNGLLTDYYCHKQKEEEAVASS